MTSAEYGKRTIMIRERTERYLTALMKRYFMYQKADIVSKLQNGINPLDNWQRWDTVLSDWIEPKVRAAIDASRKVAMEYMQAEEKSTDIQLVLRAGEVMRRLDKVNDTTKDGLEKIMSQTRAIDQSKSTLDNVLAAFTIWIASRSPVIGLTLATASSGSGVDMAMIDNPKELKKRWRAFIDEDTRAAHAEADGQEVWDNDNFIVDGEALRWPGDPYGSAGNIINCRCYVEPVIWVTNAASY